MWISVALEPADPPDVLPEVPPDVLPEVPPDMPPDVPPEAPDSCAHAPALSNIAASNTVSLAVMIVS